MNTARELAILDEAIEKLGPHSYLGPWLKQERPVIEQEMRSDFPVSVTITQAKAEALEIIDRAKAEALEIKDRAERETAMKRAEVHKEKEKLARFLEQGAARIRRVE